MSKALYRKYRSKNLDEIVGQEHITAILKRAIANDKVAHAYLLTGPRGVGKTSIARILAHEINQLPYSDETTHLDIIEIDAASNNSVEDVRDLREKVQIAPVSAKRKVYIIDEVHMLSKQAFNALLKTLEEPPAHIVFILATTDADKLPATIISRVQRFNFRPITHNDASRHLAQIAKKEGIDIDQQAVELIAQHGKGSFRDSISLLDQMQHLSDGTITHDLVMQILGLADTSLLNELLQAHNAGDLQGVVKLLDDITERGTPPALIADQLINLIRRDIATNAGHLALLDDLLEVQKSAWPEIKLLTALTKSVQTPQHVDTTTPSARSSAVTTTNRGTSDKNQSTSTKRESLPVHGSKSPEVEPTESSDKTLDSGTTTRSENTPVEGQATEDEKQSRKTTEGTITPTDHDDSGNQSSNENKGAVNTPQPFEWQKFLDTIKPKAAGAYAILQKCEYEYDGSNLTVYAGKKFNKTKLDKALPELSATLNDIGVVAEINILDKTKPPADETTANILAMMGGGEEISG